VIAVSEVSLGRRFGRFGLFGQFGLFGLRLFLFDRWFGLRRRLGRLGWLRRRLGWLRRRLGWLRRRLDWLPSRFDFPFGEYGQNAYTD
jgi:hypothetical protein